MLFGSLDESISALALVRLVWPNKIDKVGRGLGQSAIIALILVALPECLLASFQSLPGWLMGGMTYPQLDQGNMQFGRQSA